MSDAAAEPRIETTRFLLRPLTTEDATPGYLAWLRAADTRRYVLSATQAESLNDLRRYIAERMNRDDVLFLGIFVRSTGHHIGNIKYEPIDSREGSAELGILIGDPAFRGKGVASEVIRASGRWLLAQRGVSRVLLGVDLTNVAAISAYEKAGFIPVTPGSDPREQPGIVRMVLNVGHA